MAKGFYLIRVASLSVHKESKTIHIVRNKNPDMENSYISSKKLLLKSKKSFIIISI